MGRGFTRNMKTRSSTVLTRGFLSQMGQKRATPAQFGVEVPTDPHLTPDHMQLNPFIFLVGLNNSANSPCEPSKKLYTCRPFEAKWTTCQALLRG